MRKVQRRDDDEGVPGGVQLINCWRVEDTHLQELERLAGIPAPNDEFRSDVLEASRAWVIATAVENLEQPQREAFARHADSIERAARKLSELLKDHRHRSDLSDALMRMRLQPAPATAKEARERAMERNRNAWRTDCHQWAVEAVDEVAELASRVSSPLRAENLLDQFIDRVGGAYRRATGRRPGRGKNEPKNAREPRGSFARLVTAVCALLGPPYAVRPETIDDRIRRLFPPPTLAGMKYARGVRAGKASSD